MRRHGDDTKPVWMSPDDIQSASPNGAGRAQYADALNHFQIKLGWPLYGLEALSANKPAGIQSILSQEILG